MSKRCTKYYKTGLEFLRSTGSGSTRKDIVSSWINLAQVSKNCSESATGGFPWKRYWCLLTRWSRGWSTSTAVCTCTEISSQTTFWSEVARDSITYTRSISVWPKDIEIQRRAIISHSRMEKAWLEQQGMPVSTLTSELNRAEETISNASATFSSTFWKEVYLGKEWRQRQELKSMRSSRKWRPRCQLQIWSN